MTILLPSHAILDVSALGASDIVGFSGVALLIGTYGALQIGKMSAEAPLYSILNAVAALLILFSLFFSFNAASFVIEIFWFLISLIGLARSFSKTRKDKN